MPFGFVPQQFAGQPLDEAARRRVAGNALIQMFAPLLGTSLSPAGNGTLFHDPGRAISQGLQAGTQSLTQGLTREAAASQASVDQRRQRLLDALAVRGQDALVDQRRASADASRAAAERSRFLTEQGRSAPTDQELAELSAQQRGSLVDQLQRDGTIDAREAAELRGIAAFDDVLFRQRYKSITGGDPLTELREQKIRAEIENINSLIANRQSKGDGAAPLKPSDIRAFDSLARSYAEAAATTSTQLGDDPTTDAREFQVETTSFRDVDGGEVSSLIESAESFKTRLMANAGFNPDGTPLDTSPAPITPTVSPAQGGSDRGPELRRAVNEGRVSAQDAIAALVEDGMTEQEAMLFLLRNDNR